jgi:hypothetical protein
MAAILAYMSEAALLLHSDYHLDLALLNLDNNPYMMSSYYGLYI